MTRIFPLRFALALLLAAQFSACSPPSLSGVEITASPSDAQSQNITRTYEDWVEACRALTPNRSLRGRYPSKETLPLKTFAEFDVVLSAFLQLSSTGALRQATNWIGLSPEKDGFFDTSRAYFLRPPPGTAPVRFQPFAQKLSVAPESEIFVRGDLHGDVQSLITDLEWLNAQKFLDGFRIARPNFYMLFLGDYTDRGMYGTEVLYTILRLKLANPDRVFMSRGNHEDLSLVARYGYFHEGRAKYGDAFNIGRIARAYDFLPVVIYLETGDSAIQCNHGGMEPGYDPRSLLEADGPVRFQLLGTLRQKEFISSQSGALRNFSSASRDLLQRAMQDYQPQDPVSPTVLGFMWNDFTLLATDPEFSIDPDRAFIFGQAATDLILQTASSPKRRLQAVFRAHQHAAQLNPMMRRLVAGAGVFRHWQSTDSPALLDAPIPEIKKHIEHSGLRAIPPGSVWTFNVGPDSAYGDACGYAFDTFGILKTAAAFEDWRLRIVNVTSQ